MFAQNNTRRGRISRALAVFGAAISVSAAVEGGRRPRHGDLKALGIDPQSFDQLG